MAFLSRFSDVLRVKLKAHIQNVVSEKTKIATKYDIKIFKGKSIYLKTWPFQKRKYFCKIISLFSCFFFRDFY